MELSDAGLDQRSAKGTGPGLGATDSVGAIPRVTIGVPVYNGGRFLARTLESLLAQTYSDFELIISDNASTDDTESICRSFSARDSRVRYVRNAENRGAAWNLNRLFELGRGEYFKWAMADDVCQPRMVEVCVAALDRNPDAVLACVRTTFIDEDDGVLRNLDPGWDLRSDQAHRRLSQVIFAGGHWVNADALAGVIRREALCRTTLIPRYQGGDKRLLAELSLLGKFIEIPEYMYLRRQHPESSGRNNPEFAKDRTQAITWMADFFKSSRAEVARPTWHLFVDHLKLVGRSQLPLSLKILLVTSLLRFVRWNWMRLMKELEPV
jgi:glycosyltransferase involved in cell wall biosynthesis